MYVYVQAAADRTGLIRKTAGPQNNNAKCKLHLTCYAKVISCLILRHLQLLTCTHHGHDKTTRYINSADDTVQNLRGS